MASPEFDPRWAVIFGVLGNTISFMVFLAPLLLFFGRPTFYRIWRKKSTEDFKSLPYLVALFSCLLWLYYAFLKSNEILLITINSFGLVVETIYIIMYLIYATRDTKKSSLRLIVAIAAAFLLAVTITHYSATTGDMRVKVFGWICVTVSVAVFASPLSIAARVIRTRSVEFMPFSPSFFLTLSAVMWFGYGFFRKDPCVAIPNIIGFLLGMSQMILYAVYRNADKVISKEKLPEHVREIVMINGNGIPDAHPVVDIALPISADDAIVGDEGPNKPQEISKNSCNV